MFPLTWFLAGILFIYFIDLFVFIFFSFIYKLLFQHVGGVLFAQAAYIFILFR